jgi:hypothetical protein
MNAGEPHLVSAPESLSNDELKLKIATALQEWPLYRELHYTGAGLIPSAPQELTLFCGHAKCGFKTSWILVGSEAVAASRARGVVHLSIADDFRHAKYKCNNCRVRVARFFYYWRVTDKEGWFYKAGQHPELEERIPKGLEEKLSPDDLKTYKKALRMRNFNLGLAAVAYMRRIVENRMNDMLEVLHEAATTHAVAPDILAQHEVMMNEKKFKVKVDYAGELLPQSLRPPGKPNPMAILHELASDGLHAKSDEACVDIFDSCRQTFEYVFGKMRLENEEAKKFVSGMAALSDRRSKILADATKKDSN